MALEHVSEVGVYQDLAAGMLSVVYLMLVYYLFVIKNRSFTSYDIKPHILPNSQLNISDFISHTVKVKTGLFIRSFPEFDVKKGFFIMDALVWFEFNPSLISLEGIDDFTFGSASRTVKSKPDIHLGNNNDLLVKYSVQIFFSANMDNRFFPMNDHQLFIVLTNEHFTPYEIVFDVKTSFFDFSDDLNTQDWYIYSKQVESGYVDICLDEDDKAQILFPRVVFILSLKKAGLRKVALIIIPILILVFLSTTSALPILAASTLSIAIGCLTGMLGYRYVINSISPNVGYYTLAEHIYNVALGLCFLTFAITLNKNFIQLTPFGMDVGVLWFAAVKIIMLVCIYYLLYRWNPYLNRNSSDVSSSTYKHRVLGKSKQYQNITLSDFLAYMKTANQHVSPDNDDPFSPDYSGFYNKYRIKLFKRTWIARMSTKFYCCSPTFITDLLLNCHSMYQAEYAALNGHDYILKLPVSDNSNVIVFGDLSGSFHDLGIHLQQLKKMGVLDEQLQLLSPNDYIIFNGNVISGSPFLLETLSIVMILLLKNPNQVFYVQGESENYHTTLTQPIGQEIGCKLANIQNNLLKTIPVLMERFLSSLPLAIYLQKTDQNKTSIVRITSRKIEKTDKTNQLFKMFILQPSKTLETFELNNDTMPCEFTLGIELDAIIQKSDSLQTSHSGKTVSLLPPAKGTMVWGICSSFRLLGNSDTGFVVLKTPAAAPNWTLNVYKQARDVLHDYHMDVFNMMYAYILNDQSSSLRESVSQDEFILSSTMDLSKTASIVSQRIYHGIYTKLIEQNGLGGIRGRRLKLAIVDDEYTPAIAKKNVLELIDHYPSKIILSPVGTPTIENYSQLIYDKKIMVMFPISGGSLLRKPEFDHLVFFRSSFSKEGQELIKFAVDKKGARRFAVFYQDDSYGIGVLNGVKATLEAIQVDWIPVPYQRNNPNIERGVMEIRNFNADAILFFSTAPAAIALIHHLGIPQVSNMSLIAISYASNHFQEFLQSVNLKLIRTHLVPPLDANIQIVKEYHQSLKNHRFNIGPSDESLEGYINMNLLSYLMESIDPPITKEKMIERIHAFQPINYKGLPLQFNPMTRELYNEIWIESDMP